MHNGLKMPQFEIVEIKATDCQESFQIGTSIKMSRNNKIPLRIHEAGKVYLLLLMGFSSLFR